MINYTLKRGGIMQYITIRAKVFIFCFVILFTGGYAHIAIAQSSSVTPPTTWTEHWFELDY